MNLGRTLANFRGAVLRVVSVLAVVAVALLGLSTASLAQTTQAVRPATASHLAPATEYFYGETNVDPNAQGGPLIPLSTIGPIETTGYIVLLPGAQATLFMRDGKIIVTHSPGGGPSWTIKTKHACYLYQEDNGTFGITAGNGVWTSVRGGGNYYIDFEYTYALPHGGACPKPNTTAPTFESVSFYATALIRGP